MAGSTNISINNCTIPPANLGVTGNVAIGSSFVTATPPTNGMIIQGAMGVGTTAPSNLLDVSGGVAIGTQYVGVTTAPTSGLIVQGNVGIGTTLPSSHTVGYTVLGINGSTGGLLSFETNGGEVATIYNNNGSLYLGAGVTNSVLLQSGGGKVGIGTASPASLFSVYGGGLAVGTYAATTTIGTGSIIASGKVGIGTSTVTNALDVYGGAAHGTYAGQTAPTNGMIISGAVGIGTNSPLVSLDLSRNTDALALPAGTTGQEPSNAVNGMIRYNSTIPDLEAFIGGYWTTLTTGGSAASIYLGTSRLAPDPAASASDTQTGLYTAGTGKVDVSSQGSQVVEISTSGMNVLAGNVGIGTILPLANLDIEGGVNASSIRLASSGAGVAVGLYAANISNYDVIRWYQGLVGEWETGLDPNQGFYINPAVTNGNTGSLIYLAHSGKVGIGTTAPSNLLDVNGGVAIGTQYVGVSTAPTSGLIVQGKVGIGTTVPSFGLTVEGTPPAATGDTSTVARFRNDLATTGSAPAYIIAGTRQGLNTAAWYLGNDANNNAVWASNGIGSSTRLGNDVNGAYTESMRITGTGLVGIGTTAPSNLLDVNGGVAIGTQYVGVTTAPTSGLIVQGNVGIGTTNTSFPLDISGSASGASNLLSLWNSNGGVSASSVLRFAVSSVSDSTTNADAQIAGVRTQLTPGAVALTFSPESGGSAPAEVMRITNAGVGIGTTLPYVSLDLHSKTDALALPVGTTGQEPSSPLNGMIRYNSTVPGLEAYIANAWTALTTGGSGASIYLGSSAVVPNPAASVTDTQTGFYTSAAGHVDVTSKGTQVIDISTSGMNVATGNVGIGTSSPQATLDVNGFTKLALNASAPVACTAATDGSIALTHTRNTCVCVGSLSAWTNMVLGNACIW